MKAGILDSAANGVDPGRSSCNSCKSKDCKSCTSDSFTPHPHQPLSNLPIGYQPRTAEEHLDSHDSAIPDQEENQTRAYRAGHQQPLQPAKGHHGEADSEPIGTSEFVATGPTTQPLSLSDSVLASVSQMSFAMLTPKDRSRPSSEATAAPEPGGSSTHESAWRLWSSSLTVLIAALCGMGFLFLIGNSLATQKFDAKGCRMSYMRPSYVKFHDFDTEHTRFASKYSLYLYREQGIDYGPKLRGIPVLFVPGNAGSYKQVRPIAAEAASYFASRSEVYDPSEVLNLDFFTVDFNEDITAFHGQTLLDQAEYLNEAIRYILSLYLDPESSNRDRRFPDPSSVIILGHSMGGVVARAMVMMPNYQPNSINTILTMSAPHARPPVTFDSQIVQIYAEINNYWRSAYLHKWANDNPLWHVTLVSIAGGGLDTVVPSDYASVQSLVPDTHGFTVFTTTIPYVWTSMDHQAILWCDQFRKVVTRALYDIVDARRSSQTRPRAERIRVLRKHFLSGLEADIETGLSARTQSTIIKIADSETVMVAPGKPFVLPQLGKHERPSVFLLAVPPGGQPSKRKFTMLTNSPLAPAGPLHDGPEVGIRQISVAGAYATDGLSVFVCNKLSSYQSEETHHRFSLDLSGGKFDTIQLVCKTTVLDFRILPTRSLPLGTSSGMMANHAPDAALSYLEYALEEITDQQFVVVVERTTLPSAHFVAADFPSTSSLKTTISVSIWQLLRSGATLSLPPNRSFVHEWAFPMLHSSLLAYRLDIVRPLSCRTLPERGPSKLFSPIVRQHVGIPYPYESKYHAVVDGNPIGISVHGEAPFLPSPLPPLSAGKGALAIQLWMDPVCKDEASMMLSLDIRGSMGLLYMRYRTILAAFPLFVTALVLSIQFRTYDSTGVFVSFTHSLDTCIKGILPALLLLLTAFSMGIGAILSTYVSTTWCFLCGSAVAERHHHQHTDLFTGTTDPVFWFIMPLIGAVSIGVCTAMHYVLLALTTALCSLYRAWLASQSMVGIGSLCQRQPDFAPSSTRRRLVTTGILLLLVSTFLPYQFAYLVACMVQVLTTVRACCLYLNINSAAHENFYNYAHSVLVLMLWILPINLPTLTVWIRNLSVHWLTPFSSHHNVWSIMPFIILVENMTSGRMIPRLSRRLSHVTTVIFVWIAIYTAAYGVSYAYRLHHLANLASAWLVLVHLMSQPWPFSRAESGIQSVGYIGEKDGAM